MMKYIKSLAKSHNQTNLHRRIFKSDVTMSQRSGQTRFITTWIAGQRWGCRWGRWKPKMSSSHVFTNSKSRIFSICNMLCNIYRVFHIEVFFLNWLWQIEICKLDFVWRWFWHPEIMQFEFQLPVFKEITHSGLNSLLQKKLLKFTMIFHDSTKNKYFPKIKIKLNSRTWILLKSLVVILRP